MGQIKVTDDLLKDILPKVSDELVKEWENAEVEEHTFSKGFNKKMKKFIWKNKNKQLIKELKIVGKVAAALLLLVGVCFFGNTMVARANLDVLFRKIEVALEDASMYVYDEKTGTYSYTLYEPEYVPEGYEEINRQVDDKNVSVRYIDEEGNRIHWKQMIVETGMIVSTDSEFDDILEKEYAGDNVKIYLYSSGRKRLYYESGNCAFTLSVDNISVEEIYEMIQKMKKIEK